MVRLLWLIDKDEVDDKLAKFLTGVDSVHGGVLDLNVPVLLNLTVVTIVQLLFFLTIILFPRSQIFAHIDRKILRCSLTKH